MTQEDEPHAIGSGELWLLDLQAEDDEFPTEKVILCDDFGHATREVCHRRENSRVARRLGEVEEGLIEGREEMAEAKDEPVGRVEHAN